MMAHSLSSSSSIQVQGTNDNSIVSKLSMVNLGYIDDPYLKHFVIKPQRRSPLINRGYYIRSKAVRFVVKKFLQDFPGRKQIVSLGAGFDTTFFWTKNQLSLSNELFFIEIDYPDVMRRKVTLAKSSGLLSAGVECINNENILYRNGDYLAIGFDLRNVGAELRELLAHNQVDFTVPTLFISEVVLTYLTGSQSSRVIGWINHCFKNSILFIFEQMLPDDGFGQIMCRHFEKIGSPLSSIQNYPTLESQETRHNKRGFTVASSTDLHTFYNNLSPCERQRINSIELFDEYEGWHQMCLHYFLLSSTNSANEDLRYFCRNLFDFSPIPGFTGNLPSEQSTCIVRSSVNMLHLFGHSMCLMRGCHASNKALIVGGFGVPYSDNDRSVSHQRLSNVYKVNLSTCDVVECQPTCDKINYSMFSTINSYHDNNGEEMFIMFGGRTSPNSTTNEVRCVKVNGDQYKFSRLFPHSDEEVGSQPPGRWRHTSTILPDNELVPRMVVIGGCDKNTTFSDCWCFYFKSFKWKQFMFKPTNENDFLMNSGELKSRHSHSTVVWRRNSENVLVVSCGVDEAMQPLNDVFVITVDNNFHAMYERLDITPSLHPRYAHTSHIVRGDLLLLIGGVTFPSSSQQRGCGMSQQDHIAIIDLETSTWMRSVKIPVSFCDRPLRLHGHTSTIVYNDKECLLVVIGGGSNCFSFGTSFNETPLCFNLPLM